MSWRPFVSVCERQKKIQGQTPKKTGLRWGASSRHWSGSAPGNFAKYQKLLEWLKPGGFLKWNPSNPADRIVIFTERIETLRFLELNLGPDLKLKPDQVAVVHGSGIEDIDLQKIVEDFGRDRSPVRLLLASDIASEGLNLHFLCHKLIHFDIPWSLMVFQQRNGRIDRYGQERQPHIAYLYTESEHPKIRGDLRILELLMEKDENAAKNIGDPSVFLGVFDAREEEQMTGKAIEENLAPAEFNRRMEKAAEDDLLAILFGEAPIPAGETARSRCHTFPSLFADDLAYFREGLSGLNAASDLQADFDVERQLVTLTVNDDLRRVFRALPGEALPEDGRIHFTTSRERVKKAIKDSRAEESNWPDVHLLWDLHPVMEWLNFKLMVAFGRKQAPAMRLAGTLASGESLFLIQGEIPNKKGQPVIHEWFAVRFQGQRNVGVLPLQDFLKLTQLDKRNYPNPGEVRNFHRPSQPIARPLSKRPAATCPPGGACFRRIFRRGSPEEIQNLATCRAVSCLSSNPPSPRTRLSWVRGGTKNWNGGGTSTRYSPSYRNWVEETLTTEDSPFLRVAAVFLG